MMRSGEVWEEVSLEIVGEGANGPVVFLVGTEYLWVLSHAMPLEERLQVTLRKSCHPLPPREFNSYCQPYC